MGSPVGTSVDELARALSEKERKALLERISRSLSIEDESQRRIIHGNLRAERRNELMAADINRLSVWEKFQLWIKRLVSGRADEDVFLRFRLGQARQRVRDRSDGFIDFENRVVEEGLPEAIRGLSRKAAATREFFAVLWQDTDSLRGVLDFLLARRVPDARRSLAQFCSTQEMQEVFRTTESRNQLKQLVLDRVSAYVEGIPEAVMEEIEQGLRPLYLLKDLALFNFDEFYVQFQSTEADANREGEVHFTGASAVRVLDTLEELYLALHGVNRISGSVSVYPEVINYYYARRDNSIDAERPTEIPESSQLPAMRSAIHALVEEAKRVRAEVPLVDIVRYFRNDPYYRFLAYVPRLKLRDFYYSNLKIEVLQELDRRFNDLRMGVLGQLTQETFPGGLKQFEYFHPEIQSAVKRSGVGQLQVYRGLQTVQSFMHGVYRQGLLDFMRILGKLLPQRTRQSGVDLTLSIAGLDDVAERLRSFDLSFSPESDDGKTFYRFRYAGNERDASQTAAFKALIAQKEREAIGIIEKFQDQLRSLHQTMLFVKKSAHSQLNERYRSFESTSAEERPFDSRLDAVIRSLESTQKILNQMIRIDHEG